MTDAQVTEATRLRATGLSLARISAAVGVPFATVRRALERAGAPRVSVVRIRRGRSVEQRRAVDRERKRRAPGGWMVTARPMRQTRTSFGATVADAAKYLTVLYRGYRPSDWREDAAQDRALAELERTHAGTQQAT